jgi:acyl-CoA synthetase (AMP-forming)/AMP-acid ligase II
LWDGQQWDLVGGASRPIVLEGSTSGPGNDRYQDEGRNDGRGRSSHHKTFRRTDSPRGSIRDRAGWLRTGDAARADDEGYVWIVDRVEDAYVSLGEVVFPGDIERVLALHPSVAEAGVVGVLRGEGRVGRVFVVPAKAQEMSANDLLAFCRERLKPHEVPESITVVERLPRNSVASCFVTSWERSSDRGGCRREPSVFGVTAPDLRLRAGNHLRIYAS